MVRVSVALLGACTLLASCGGEGDSAARETRATGKARVIRLAEYGRSGESGTVTLTPIGASTNVLIELNTARRERQPAHIHGGTCDDLGEIAYHLHDVEHGSSETRVHASLSFLSGASDAAFAVDVHEAAGDTQKRVACGTLSSGLPAPP